MTSALAGKVAVITGASQGIGEAVARLFAAEGARLVVSDVTDAVEPVAASIRAAHPGSNAVGTVTDATDPAAAAALIKEAVMQHGALDVLVHATAVMQDPGPTADLDPQEWDRVMAVNAKGAFLLAKSALPVLTRPGGSIVFTGSFSGEVGQAGRTAYSASKGALRLFTQGLALEVAEEGIRVNGVAPGSVDSAILRDSVAAVAAARGLPIEQVQEQLDSSIPLRRQAAASEVAQAFLYLASDAASYVTGTWLDVNGGTVLR